MPARTPLYEAHIEARARMVDFGGWEMPINYGSQIEEHHSVRQAVGMFDVSHMTVVDLKGEQARPFLAHLLANDVDKLQLPGKALYSCMLNEQGGVIDDLITYFMDEYWFRVVVNASTRDKDLAWLNLQAEHFSVEVQERPELAMIAVQGPNARKLTAQCFSEENADAVLGLKPFCAANLSDYFVARTGYTGEDGFELVLPAEMAAGFWRDLLAAGVRPCGLGARDTLRLEAGMNLYGQDMDEDVSPLESGLSWTLSMDTERDFIGKQAVLAQSERGIARKQVGLVLSERGVLRHGQEIHSEIGTGEVTSGSYSPTLEKAIALARVPTDLQGKCEVEIRGRLLEARIVKPPFVRDGQPRAGILD